MPAATTMKAAVCTTYGPPEVVELHDVPMPVPTDDEVLVKAAATTVNSGDARVRGLNVPRGMTTAMRLRLGFTKPRHAVLGFDSLTHYGLAPASAHTAAMNASIRLEVATATLLLAAVVSLTARYWRIRKSSPVP